MQMRHRAAELKKHRNVEVSSSTVLSVFTGLYGMKALFYDSSTFSHQGLKLRGKSFKEVPMRSEVEGVFWHALTGDSLSSNELNELRAALRDRQGVPSHIDKMLETLPKSVEPITAFSIGVLGLQSDSKFARQQSHGMEKKDQHKPTLEDVLDLLAKAPLVAGKIFRLRHSETDIGKAADPWDRLAEQIGLDSATFKLVVGLRAEKEGGRIDAHLASSVNSTLADAYYSYAALVNAFAGPKLTSALQMSIRQLSSLKLKSTRLQLAEQYVGTPWYKAIYPNPTHFCSAADSRLACLKEHLLSQPASEIVELSLELSEALPMVMAEDQAAALSFDTLTGAALYSGGLRDAEFYPVIDALASGVTSLANLVLNRALLLPIEYPISTDIEGIEEVIAAKLARN